MLTVKLAIVAAGCLLIGAAVALGLRPAPGPVPSLHSVWCVRDGYPADLALPVVVGPGTGLAGCPLGERQVTEP